MGNTGVKQKSRKQNYTYSTMTPIFNIVFVWPMAGN